MRPAYIVAGVVVAWGLYVAWTITQDQQAQADDGWLSGVDGILSNPLQSAAETVDNLTASMFKISNMSRVDKALVNHPNMRAMFAVIRRGEGTAGPNGYRTMYGGGLFDSFADHPRTKVKKWGITSSAAGAYQALTSSWDETARIMNLPDFSPASQDLFCLGRIAARGALDDVIRGDLTTAIAKLNREWASLPGSPYGQGTINMATVVATFAAAGGINSNVA